MNAELLSQTVKLAGLCGRAKELVDELQEKKQTVAKQPQVLHQTKPAKRKRAHRFTPGTAGFLIDSYVEAQRHHVVIGNYKVSKHTREKAKEKLEDIQSTAYGYAQDLSLPTWQRLPDRMKQVFRMAGCAMLRESVAVTCNISHKVATAAMRSNKGEAYFLARIVRRVLSQSWIFITDLALMVENAHGRSGRNHGLHIHAVMWIPEGLRQQVAEGLAWALAKDYVEIAGNKAVVIKPITTAGGWAKYCTKNYKSSPGYLANPRFASQSASSAGKRLYEEIREWLGSLPPPVEPQRPEPGEMTESGRRLLDIIEAHKIKKQLGQLLCRVEAIEVHNTGLLH